MTIKKIPDGESMSYSEMRARVATLSHIVNLLTDIQVNKVDSEGNPQFVFSDTAARLDMPFISNTEKYRIEEKANQNQTNINAVQDQADSTDERVNDIEADVAAVEDDVEDIQQEITALSGGSWTFESTNFTNGAKRRIRVYFDSISGANATFKWELIFSASGSLQPSINIVGPNGTGGALFNENNQTATFNVTSQPGIWQVKGLVPFYGYNEIIGSFVVSGSAIDFDNYNQVTVV